MIKSTNHILKLNCCTVDSTSGTCTWHNKINPNLLPNTVLSNTIAFTIRWYCVLHVHVCVVICILFHQMLRLFEMLFLEGLMDVWTLIEYDVLELNQICWNVVLLPLLFLMIILKMLELGAMKLVSSNTYTYTLYIYIVHIHCTCTFTVHWNIEIEK